MSDRHPKWKRVEPGTVIPAGQPYRVEYVKEGEKFSAGSTAGEGIPGEPYLIRDYASGEWFVDSSWVPPLVLPTAAGSVIRASVEGEDGTGLMFLLDKDAISGAVTKFWMDTTGYHWDESDIVSAEVVHDARLEAHR